MATARLAGLSGATSTRDIKRAEMLVAAAADAAVSKRGECSKAEAAELANHERKACYTRASARRSSARARSTRMKGPRAGPRWPMKDASSGVFIETAAIRLFWMRRSMPPSSSVLMRFRRLGRGRARVWSCRPRSGARLIGERRRTLGCNTRPRAAARTGG